MNQLASPIEVNQIVPAQGAAWRLDDKVAVVTGASRGIGRSIAIELANAGAAVAVNYSGSKEAAQETVDTIVEAGGRARIHRADVSDYPQVNAMMKQVATDFGRIDILVNNAGVLTRSFLSMMSSDDFKRVIDVNLVGTFHCTKAVALHMMKRKSGAIVNVSSLAGSRGLVGQGAYAASKAAINNLTQVAAKEFAAYGIRINGVAPGCIDVGMMKDFSKEVEQSYVGQIAQKRYGEAHEVAHAVLFLVSGLSTYITGHVLNVDGGMLG